MRGPGPAAARNLPVTVTVTRHRDRDVGPCSVKGWPRSRCAAAGRTLLNGTGRHNRASPLALAAAAECWQVERHCQWPGPPDNRASPAAESRCRRPARAFEWTTEATDPQ